MSARRTISRCAVRSLALLTALSAGSSASLGQSLTWQNAAGGMASDAANWNPNQLPSPTTTLFFEFASSYDVTFDSGAASVQGHRYRFGNVDIQCVPSHSVGGNGFFVGTSNGDDAFARLVAGTLNAGVARVAAAAGSVGEFQVRAGATAVCTSLDVGQDGTGTLAITSSSTVRAGTAFAGYMTFGATAGGNGTGLVTGGGALLETINNRIITVGQFGQGTLTVTDQGVAESDDDFLIAPNVGAVGTVTVGGGLAGSQLIAANLDIACNSTNAAAGTGSVTVTAGGSVAVALTTRLDDPNGGTGTLTIDGGTVTTRSLICASGPLSVHLDDGDLEINGGSLQWPVSSLDLGGTTGKSPTLTLRNGASTSISQINLGTISGSAGQLALESGATVSTDNILRIGQIAGSTGVLSVTSAGSSVQHTGSLMWVGAAGSGTMNISSAGAVSTTGTAVVAEQNGSQGQVTITGAGSAWTVGNSMRIASNAALAGGNGQVLVDGGVLSVTGNIDMGTSSGAGISALSVTNNGVVNVTGNLRPRNPNASIQMNGGGTINGGALVMDAGTFTGTGRVNAQVVSTGGQPIITATGPLDMGVVNADGFGWFGTLVVGPHAVTIRDTGQARVGDASLAGGSLNGIGGAFAMLSSGDVMSGFGTVNMGVQILGTGTITPSTAAGLIVNGPITTNPANLAQNFTGTRLTLGSGGSFTGAGSIGCELFANAGSTVAATGALSLGNPLSGLGFSLGGALVTGPNTVTLRDQNNTTMGGGASITLDGGRVVFDHVLFTAGTIQGHGSVESIVEGAGFTTINATGDLALGDPASTSGFSMIAGQMNLNDNRIDLLDADHASYGGSINLGPSGSGTLVAINGLALDGLLSGSGRVGGNVHNSGQVAPGNSAGRIAIDGAYTQAIDGELLIELGGPSAVQYDVLDANAGATLSGGLRVSLINGFVPRGGQVFDVVTSPTVTGTFQAFTLPPLPHGNMRIRYMADRVRLTICIADFNNNGVIEVSDIFAMITAWFGNDPFTDFNSNASRDVGDIFAFLSIWFAGC